MFLNFNTLKKSLKRYSPVSKVFFRISPIRKRYIFFVNVVYCVGSVEIQISCKRGLKVQAMMTQTAITPSDRTLTWNSGGKGNRANRIRHPCAKYYSFFLILTISSRFSSLAGSVIHYFTCPRR